VARSTIKVTVTGDASDAQRALKDTAEASEDMGRRTSHVGDIIKGVLSAQAISAGARELTGFLRGAITAAQEDEAGQRQLAQTLQNSTAATDDQIASVERWIHNVQTGTGVLDDHLRPALGNLLRATHDTTTSQDLLATSLDISAATGRDVESVSLAIGKAYDGNISGLARLGIQVKDANGDALDWTETQKQLNETFGGAADAAAETTAGRIAILKARFTDLEEAVGGKVTPVLITLADFTENTLVPAFQLAVTWVQDNLVPAVTDLAHWVGDKVVPVVVLLAQEIAADFQPKLEAIYNFISNNVVPVLQQFAHWIADEVAPKIIQLSGFLNDHRDYVYAAAAGISLALIPALIAWAVSATAAAVATIAAAAPVIAITAALAALGVGIYYVYEHWNEITDAMGRFWAYCNSNVIPIIETVGRVLLGIATFGLSELINKLGGVSATFEHVFDVAKWVWENVYDGFHWLGDAIWSVISPIAGIFDSIISKVRWLLDHIPDIHVPGGGFFSAVTGAVGGIVPHAAGGIFTTPHIGLIAEAGPEAIIPLGRGGGLGLGGDVYVTVNAGIGTDGRSVGQQIVQVLQDHRRRVGSGLGLG
jgi:hypothetical protein